MRTLWLLRHAKSSWADPAVPDHDRPLAPRGVRAARRMSEHVRAESIRPELVLCSSARRARDTLDAVRASFGTDGELLVERGLYGATAAAMLERLRTVDEGVRSVLLVAHNPGLEDLAVQLAGDGAGHALAQLRTKFPTGALATLELGEFAWRRLSPGQAYLTRLVVPRELNEAG